VIMLDRIRPPQLFQPASNSCLCLSIRPRRPRKQHWHSVMSRRAGTCAPGESGGRRCPSPMTPLALVWHTKDGYAAQLGQHGWCRVVTAKGLDISNQREGVGREAVYLLQLLRRMLLRFASSTLGGRHLGNVLSWCAGWRMQSRRGMRGKCVKTAESSWGRRQEVKGESSTLSCWCCA
jgi:hypothetical protein